MAEAELRAAYDNPGIKVVCTSDSESLPSAIAQALAVDPVLAGRGVARCRHLKRTDKGGWKAIEVKLWDVCCADLFVTLAPEAKDRRVARINARAPAAAFMPLMVHFAVEYGPYDSFTDNVAIWHRDGQTAYLLSRDSAAILQIEADSLDAQLRQ
ncbi:hypothetical protein [Magnetospirillum sp. LM-5]|uniref:hypothetical protein n=1 Tax=Magnetospirillum sp. LM-5 TaxID=2681466 RepID=UPI00156F3002|nr:hypothetical protein [Magnetospirillum sp. LM-5]